MQSTFYGKNYYEILNVSITASNLEIQKAFRKLALTLHPDKAADDKRAQATIDFQYLVNVMDVLNDKDKRSLYDLTHDDPLVTNDDNETNKKPDSYYFQKYVNIVEILAAKEKYVGTQEEISDVCTSYEKHKGNMTAILEEIMHSTEDDVDRFRIVIDNALKNGLLKKRYEIYFGPSSEIDLVDELPSGEMVMDENGYFEPKSSNKRVRVQYARPEKTDVIKETKETNQTKETKETNERKQTSHVIPFANTQLTNPVSMREKNRQRHIQLISSLEKRFRPRNHTDQEMTEEEFERISAKLKERQANAIKNQRARSKEHHQKRKRNH